jgi:hypothetical protein
VSQYHITPGTLTFQLDKFLSPCGKDTATSRKQTGITTRKLEK